MKNAEIVYVGVSEKDDACPLTKDDLAVCSPMVKVLTAVPVDYQVAEKSAFTKDDTPILKQAENLIHVYKAVLTALAGKKNV